jgi:hypothetical protein
MLPNRIRVTVNIDANDKRVGNMMSKKSYMYMEEFPHRLLFCASDPILLLHNVSSGVFVRYTVARLLI